MIRGGVVALAALAAGVAAVVAGATDQPPEGARPWPAAPDRAFSTPVAPRDLAGLDAAAGAALFGKLWVAAPASTRASDGLGPLYNARSCAACHRNRGRAHPPEGDGPAPVGLVARLAQPDGGGDPVLGRQVQPLATAGLAGEARVQIVWQDHPLALPDGSAAMLRRPEATLLDLVWGAPDPATRTGLRAAPPLVGMGLIAAIDADAILANATRDSGGIAGRVRMVTPLDGGAPVPGRFGRRAAAATLTDATALALALDMGLSTPWLPDPAGDCTDAQAACRDAPHGDGDARVQEVAANAVGLIATHLASLGLPEPARGADALTRLGEAVFHAAGCAACHRPDYTISTTEGPRVIRPYSDFLLHDLGPAMAEAAPEAGIAASEWRTAPLWGLGHSRAVGGRESYLHDGRARTLTEAILWHGGTAAPARDRVIAMPAADRTALVAFLEGL
ncbi:MAG: di-heme oxidoredictase family protein [Gemmobacter sp.]